MKFLSMALICLFISGCGNLIISPRGCQSEGEVGSNLDIYDKKVKFSYFLFLDDLELKLKDLVECKKVDILNVELTRKFLIKHSVVIKYSEIKYDDDGKVIKN